MVTFGCFAGSLGGFDALAEPPAAPAPGMTEKSDFNFSANSKLPIVINANSLEVFQDKSMAVFTGDVVADQGQMHLKSDVMTVFYTNADDKKAQEAANPGGKKNSIKRINVDGHVFVTSPEETARGKTGYYDTVKNFLELDGDVVLTKDKDVLHGSKMTYDMNTGYSHLTPDASVNGGRVRGLFIPEDASGGAAAKQ